MISSKVDGRRYSIHPGGLAVLFVGLLVIGSPAVPAAKPADVEIAEQALRTGRYREAIEAFRRHVRNKGADAARAYRGWVRALVATGRYEEAVEKAKEFGRSGPGSEELANSLGEVLYLMGDLEEAESAFRSALAGGASDALTAELNLAILRYERGEREEALRRFDRFIDVYNQSRLSSAALTAVGTACRYLAVDNPQLLKDALRAYDEAVAADRGNLEARVRVGELFLESYNSTDAAESFKEVLEMNPRHAGALLGMARVRDFDGSAEAAGLAEQALEVNPNLVPARVFLARLKLQLEDYAEATREAEAALAVNPVSLEALSILAAAHYLSGHQQGFAAARGRALARNPRYADFYNTLSDICVQNRLYREALDFAGQAVELDENSWRGYGLMGLNQLRLGHIDEGRRNLERSFAGDPYNVWIKNTLDLLDTFPGYEETRSRRFRIVVDGRESDLLTPYVTFIAEEAYDRLAERYNYRPPTPIRLEVYPSHADFSVRTIGLVGLGALGVCFGPVIAIDSPSARDKGQFNWASTLWHELAHTVTLGLTNNKVPRWFSEGLSVHEEHRARKGWGDDVGIAFLMAHKQGKLLPLGKLNNGFVRPTYPQQIGISYYQASLICEKIERDYGFSAILEMLAAYRRGMGTDEVFGSVLGVSLEEFDQAFDAYLGKRFGGPLAALRAPGDGSPVQVLTLKEIEKRAARDTEDFSAQLALGEALFKEEKLDEAVRYLERAKALFPEYAGGDSPYWYLSQIHKKRGNISKAAEELARLTAINESHYQAHLELAALREELADEAGAAEILERALYIYPFEAPVHERLARLYEGLAERRAVIRERSALVALHPVDRAEALYNLALAFYEAGDRAGARREVLRALEIAPTFPQALELLLDLQPDSSGGRS
ncbi:MAG: tetratricopeptide repeat protein [Acidobacteriota bacterium]